MPRIRTQRAAGILDVDQATAINAKLDAIQHNIAMHFKQMSLNQALVNMVQQASNWYGVSNSLNLRPQGGLPDDTEPNPKQLNVVSTRSGLQLEELAPKKRDIEAGTKEKKVEEVVKSSNVEALVPKKKLPPPFPQRLKKQNEDKCFDNFLSLLKQVHINLPLVDILQGISKYAKYVKEVVANKRRLTEYETVALTETTFILQLTDRSIDRPDRVIEDVLVQVGSLIFLVDFVVLDFEPYYEVPFIMGRPFLATKRALIDVAVGQLTMRAHDKVEVLDVYRALKNAF
ncbi:hypothetical protein R3W88_029395 [Solanum pinnatisectum]|uniref:Uncharacterized protein n=1 Tax=Solanum pinnatisectum TaxID=50273 RepID=A0AAV9K7D5_9SOLN|nr:hypothetical protein R3W88_029395 [Solanum pinnatisectum]